MNKLGIVLGAAAVAIAAGCMDPNYVRPTTNASQNTATPVVSGDTPALTPDVKPVAEDELPGYPGEATPDIDISVAPVSGCTCAPGTIHDAPCTCGAPDCQCTVAMPPPPPQPPADVTPAPAVEETTTTYVVRPGDTLFLISKRFNVKLDSIRNANPQVKNDAIRVGQKITLPAKVDLGKYGEPLPQATPVKKEFVPYTGPTTEYTVKSGDCVSRLAAKNGITSKQLMTLNNLSNANIRIGQKILLPAAGAVAAAPAPVKQEKPVAKSEKPKVAPPPAAIPAKPAAKVEPVEVEEPVADDYPPVEETVPAPEPKVEAPASAPAAPAADMSGDYISYPVMPGEDITSLSISFGIDPSVIREINNMDDDDQLVPGQTIRLPADAQ